TGITCRRRQSPISWGGPAHEKSAGMPRARLESPCPIREIRMENPLLGHEPLPPFARIRPEHVEPGVRELLQSSRARTGQLAALERPTCATVVEPLEELQHRVSRTWSPVSHLNAVLNSDALRTSYNACLPLLSAYQTDLAQSEPLYSAYRTIAEQEGV